MVPMNAATGTLSDLGQRRFLPLGVVVSLLVHGLVLLFLLYKESEEDGSDSVLPIELVTLAEQTVQAAPAPSGVQQQAALQQRRPAPPRVQANPNPVSRVAPSRVQEPTNDVPAPPKDALQTKLEELAKLTQPDTDTRLLEGNDAAFRGSGGNGRGLIQAYSVKDFIRAQVERRWVLNLDSLAGRTPTVSIHVLLEKDGTVAKAEIVATSGETNDEVYRYVSISARNAVILSSPFNLPEGSYESVKDIVLDLNPSNVLR
jgi:hypothetical protein